MDTTQRISKNKASGEYYLAIAGRVETLCKPFLKALGVSHFWYNRYYYDGTTIEITNYKGYLNHILLEYDYLDFHEVLHQANNIMKVGQRRRAFYPVEQQLTIDFTRKLDIYNVFEIIEKKQDYIEGVSLAFDHPSTNASEIYFNSIELIEYFIKYFKKVASSFIKEAKSNLIFLPPIKTQHDFGINNICYDLASIVKNFNPYGFTPRESECITHLKRGLTYKEVAFKMGISPKTIEDYINNIKRKTGLYSKSKILQEAI